MRTFAAILILGLIVQVDHNPSFDGKTLDNSVVSSKALHGHITALYFWQTDSPTSHDQITQLNKLNSQYRKRGVELIGVGMDSDIKKFRDFVNKNKIVWPQIHGPSQKSPLSPALFKKAGNAPIVILLDPKGTQRWTGMVKDLDAAIQKELKTHPPKPSANQWRAIALASLTGASSAIKQKDFGRVVAYLSQVNPKMKNDRQVQMAALAMASQFNIKGQDAQQLKDALKDYPEAGKFVDMSQKMSSPQLQMLAKQFLRSAPPPQAPRPRMNQAKRAAGRLKIAQRYAKAGKHHEAYRILRKLVKKYDGTDAAIQAASLIAKYESDQTFKSAHALFIQNKEAKSLLMMAKNYLAAGKQDLARTQLNELIKKFPQTQSAADARLELNKLR